VGGDTTSSTSGLMLSITVLGEAKEKDIVKRSTAKSGDLIVVSGDVGAAYAGLLLLKREKEVFKKDKTIQPDFGGNEYVLERQLRPEARVDMVDRFADINLTPTAMIDISDGLASEVLHLCEESALGCHLYEDKIPIDPQTVTVAETFNLHPITCALNGGEDYELLFTVSQSDFEKINGKGEFYIIGHMTDAGSPKNLITTSGEAIPITAASRIFGCVASTSSISFGKTLKPDTMIISFLRSTILKYPSLSIMAISPVHNQPSTIVSAVASGRL